MPLQAASCQSSRNNSVACQSKPYCVWELDVYDGKKSCTHRDTASRATDPFSKEFARLKVGRHCYDAAGL